MEKYRGKIFNEEVFETYMRKVPSTKRNALIGSTIFQNVNKYKAKQVSQTGGFYQLEPIYGRIGGEEVNYDGETDITSSSRDTFVQGKIAFGRAKAWGEYDYVSEITGKDFMAEASEIKEYWDEKNQQTVLSMLKGIFSMTGSNDFVSKHTYEITSNLSADSLNRAAQKALGDFKSDLSVIFMHSAVATNLEGVNLIEYNKYTDERGITKDLTIGTWNGRTVIVDDDMPTEDGYDKATENTPGALKVVANSETPSAGEIKLSDVNKGAFKPADVAAGDYVVPATNYTSYVMKSNFFEFEDMGTVKPVELDRNAKDKGGHTDLISRVRYMIVPYLISYKDQTKKSPLNSDFANGSNWELANNNDSSNKVYIDPKLVPLVRIKSRG